MAACWLLVNNFLHVRCLRGHSRRIQTASVGSKQENTHVPVIQCDKQMFIVHPEYYVAELRCLAGIFIQILMFLLQISVIQEENVISLK